MSPAQNVWKKTTVYEQTPPCQKKLDVAFLHNDRFVYKKK